MGSEPLYEATKQHYLMVYGESHDNFTWKGLDNAAIHASLAICVFYAVTIAAFK
ncbi:MAG: hypothetical protein ACP5KU_05570 [Candidatus Bathyarchaeia archaeon]